MESATDPNHADKAQSGIVLLKAEVPPERQVLNMKVSETDLAGVLIIEPQVHRDERGFFVEVFQAERYAQYGVPTIFQQDNRSWSVHRTLRGLHLQIERPQGKLVHVVEGEVWDVVVDVRPHSSTFRRWIGVALSAENFKQLYVPPGYAHGFCVTTSFAQVAYKCTEIYDPGNEAGIAFDDPELAIAWPVADPLLSARDRRNPTLAEFVASVQRRDGRVSLGITPSSCADARADVRSSTAAPRLHRQIVRPGSQCQHNATPANDCLLRLATFRMLLVNRWWSPRR